jgi:tripartite-type tricarboxylate transporter receptor subunit TctC
VRSLLLAASLLAALAGPAFAQADYPNRPVRLIIPFPPGGSNDVVGRVIAQHLGESLGKQVIVDNRAGAGGVIGTEVASKAAPDGYTLLGISLAHAVNPWLYKLPYDPIKAFAPIGIMGKGPVVLSVNPGLPVHSVKELVALAKSKPGDLQYASAGVGSFQHLSAELFKLTAGVDILHIPFKGGGPAMTDVMGGHTKVLFSSLVQTTPHIKSGKLRALAVGGTERSPVLPDLPTVAEAGVPGYASENWWGIVAPAGTPAPIIEKLYQALTQAQDNPEAKKYFDAEGAAIVKMSTAAFGQFMVSEMDKWQRVVKEGNIKAE